MYNYQASEAHFIKLVRCLTGFCQEKIRFRYIVDSVHAVTSLDAYFNILSVD